MDAPTIPRNFGGSLPSLSELSSPIREPKPNILHSRENIATSRDDVSESKKFGNRNVQFEGAESPVKPHGGVQETPIAAAYQFIVNGWGALDIQGRAKLGAAALVVLFMLLSIMGSGKAPNTTDNATAMQMAALKRETKELRDQMQSIYQLSADLKGVTKLANSYESLEKGVDSFAYASTERQKSLEQRLASYEKLLSDRHSMTQKRYEEIQERHDDLKKSIGSNYDNLLQELLSLERTVAKKLHEQSNTVRNFMDDVSSLSEEVRTIGKRSAQASRWTEVDDPASPRAQPDYYPRTEKSPRYVNNEAPEYFERPRPRSNYARQQNDEDGEYEDISEQPQRQAQAPKVTQTPQSSTQAHPSRQRADRAEPEATERSETVRQTKDIGTSDRKNADNADQNADQSSVQSWSWSDKLRELAIKLKPKPDPWRAPSTKAAEAVKPVNGGINAQMDQANESPEPIGMWDKLKGAGKKFAKQWDRPFRDDAASQVMDRLKHTKASKVEASPKATAPKVQARSEPKVFVTVLAPESDPDPTEEILHTELPPDHPEAAKFSLIKQLNAIRERSNGWDNLTLGLV
ncbi:hypothetical protein M427DRAFT_65462, partial [Gonapodya prolifera JEL478]